MTTLLRAPDAAGTSALLQLTRACSTDGSSVQDPPPARCRGVVEVLHNALRAPSRPHRVFGGSAGTPRHLTEWSGRA
ncbi:hypothetical protein [Pseudonocardia sp. MH-G8]|uniref:hypothetical protein n=1 Tax=Pseudonocardia sp. MH-G8 TaxID=1854588 RepID=UPI000BA0A16E|nr:hypothetical protein [Pseudonocardia sp. MH-G8]OZM75505.1 hypothetical protein CFP66_46055 [Pseudonocardia sp. MH-G8]